MHPCQWVNWAEIPDVHNFLRLSCIIHSKSLYQILVLPTDLFYCLQVSMSVPRSLDKYVTKSAVAKSLQLCPTLCDPRDGSPPGSPHPWDSPGKNTGVDCHFLLQCMKMKSESEVAQSCPTLRDPMDCSLPGSSTHGIFQARVLEWGAIAFSI